MERFSVNGSLTAAPGKRDELLQYLLEAAQEMEQVENCYIYSVGIDPEDDAKVYVYEVWEDQDAHQASLTLDVFRNLIEKAKPIIAGMDDYPNLIIKGGKGIK
ncbi:antibiotic biosynthesis monooxygenase [Aerococcaceae bacterium DSM 111176]|nr:antibiotic biosynthesis monooxygenase [Aerococcaceae bacterium DSM 111176]